MTRLILSVGAVFGLVAVGLGAFGAHGLKDRVAVELLTTWATAADYLALHALALLALGSLSAQRPDSKLLVLAAWCFIVGGLVFSGSLFVLVLTDVRAWGAVTPIGGTLLIAGWAVLAAAVWRAFPPER
ncbi:MAG: DUF423 domain-containing protein [Pseudomonadota bacterium]|nr:DUF423 domain-containing protein [Pseudomonadota bacterium]